jgi:hypothetical protein
MKYLSSLASLALAALAAVAAPTNSATTTRQDYVLGGGLVLQLDVPAAWQGGLGMPVVAGGMPTVQFASEVSPPLPIVLSPVPFADPKDAEESVTRAAVEIHERIVETNPTIVSFTGDHGRGWYFVATDKQYADSRIVPGPGEYKYLTQGTLHLGKQSIIFTILTNDDSRSIEAPALAMIKKAAIKSGSSSA